MSERATPLTSKEKSRLRGLVHHERPAVQIGKAALEPSVLAAVDEALAAREVIKVRVGRSCPLEPKVAGARLATALDAELIATTGGVVVLYRPAPEPPPAREERA